MNYLPESHHGKWAGLNRLWMEDRKHPERSDGQIAVQPAEISYAWTFRGEAQTGNIHLRGPAAALRAHWTDTFHAAAGMDLYGAITHGFARFTGTWPAGEDIEWGWLIELDFRDPEHFLLRMFVAPPEEEPAIAVDLHGSRVA